MKTLMSPASARAATAGTAQAAAHAAPMVEPVDHSADTIVASGSGWMAFCQVKEDDRPGAAVGRAPRRGGVGPDVVAIPTRDTAAGDRVMVMIHGARAGMTTGTLEYSLGASEDGPIPVDGKVAKALITVR